jgi:hypothetical protein
LGPYAQPDQELLGRIEEHLSQAAGLQIVLPEHFLLQTLKDTVGAVQDKLSHMAQNLSTHRCVMKM